jgi:subtilisin family serine protease
MVQSGDISEIEIDDIVDKIIERPDLGSKREYVLHFESKKAYNGFVEVFDAKLEFPYLKMVRINEYAIYRPIFESMEGVDGVFDVTDARFNFIDPVENNERIITRYDPIKASFEQKSILNAQPLWDLGYEGQGTVFYDIDTGINTAHTDFAGRINHSLSLSFIQTQYGYVFNDPSIEDTNGHGSHTAGSAAGDGSTAGAAIGLAPEAEIIVGRVEVQQGTIPFDSLLASWDYAISLGKVDVVNFSIGGTDEEGLDPLELAIEEAAKSGIVACCSAGNDDNDNNYAYDIHNPSSAPNAISVAATLGDTVVADYSMIGPTQSGHVKPDVAAPGTNIYSCWIGGATAYNTISGTSMATPSITGGSAILIQALQDNSIPYHPGLIKAALMNSATPPASNSHYVVGAGIPDLEEAYNIISAAPLNGSGFPVVLYTMAEFPDPDDNDFLQGYHGEYFVRTVSSTPGEDLAPSINGTVAQFLSMNTTAWTGPWSKNYYISIDIPDDATIGTYDGYITFTTSQGVEAATYINIEVKAGSGKILYAKKFTDYPFDYLGCQYKFVEQTLKSKGISVNPYHSWNITGERNIISEEVLEGYDAIWIFDPFNYQYPDGYSNPYWIWPAPTPADEAILAGEITAIQNYIDAGGSLLINFLGEVRAAAGLTASEGMHVGTINDLLDPYGIVVDDTHYSFEEPELANVVKTHAVTNNVNKIDHFGTTLTASGDADVLVEYEGEGILAVYENDVGGRIVTLCTNFMMDTAGYKEAYHSGTSNKICTDNIFDWLVAKEKIMGSYTEDSSGASFEFTSLVPAATLTATLEVTTESGKTTTTPDLSEVSAGEYTYRLDFGDQGKYKFIVESADDTFVAGFIFDSIAPVITEATGWTNNTVPTGASLAFSIEDATSKVMTADITLNGDKIYTQGLETKIVTFSIFASALIDGDNTLNVLAIDEKGNELDVTYNIPTTGGTEENPLPMVVVVFGLLSLAAITTIFRRKLK